MAKHRKSGRKGIRTVSRTTVRKRIAGGRRVCKCKTVRRK